MHKPLQVCPLVASLNPERQLHTKEPAVSVQVWSHPPLLTMHSFTSERVHIKFDRISRLATLTTTCSPV